MNPTKLLNLQIVFSESSDNFSPLQRIIEMSGGSDLKSSYLPMDGSNAEKGGSPEPKVRETKEQG